MTFCDLMILFDVDIIIIGRDLVLLSLSIVMQSVDMLASEGAAIASGKSTEDMGTILDGMDRLRKLVAYLARISGQFDLVKRFGLKTLSADDILKHTLSSPSSGLDVICVLDEKQGSRGKRAVLLTGPAAEDHLRRLLK